MTILGQGIHLCRRKSTFHLQTLRKGTKMGIALSVGPREKVRINDPLHNFGSKNPSVSTESKFHLRPLRKSTKMGLAWCPLVLEKKWELTTPQILVKESIWHEEIKISPLALMAPKGEILMSVGHRWIPWPLWGVVNSHFFSMTNRHQARPILVLFLMAKGEILISVDTDGFLDPKLWGVS